MAAIAMDPSLASSFATLEGAVAMASSAGGVGAIATHGPAEPQLPQCGPILEGPGADRLTEPFKLPSMSSSEADAIAKARKFAMEQSIKTVLVKQTINHQQQQVSQLQENIQRQQAMALMCRIYIGSINFDVREDTLKTAFAPFGPIRNVSMTMDHATGRHKGFAFIEFENPESAQLALEQMNGVLISSRNIKVGRPSNVPAAQQIIAQVVEEARQRNRVFVASVHTSLTDDDLRNVFEAFGSIRACYLQPDPTKLQRHRGYGYVEYETSSSADDAVQSMNLFDLGGQLLRVIRCMTLPGSALLAPVGAKPVVQSQMPTASAVAAATITAKLTALDSQLPPQVAAQNQPQQQPPQASPGYAIPPPGVLSQPPIPASMLQRPPQPGPAPPPQPPFMPGGGPPGLMPPRPPFMGQGAPPPNFPPGAPVPPPQAPQPVQAPPPPPQNPVMAAFMGGGNPKESQSLEQQENMEIKGKDARHMVMQKLMRAGAPCRVMVLRNMVGADEIDEELQSEVTEECSRYGPVARVIIYQERQGEQQGAEVIVKIFVEFTNGEQDVERACNGLNGRYFGGRLVTAEKYDQHMFEIGDLSA